MNLNDVCKLIVDCPHTTAPDEGTGVPLIRTPNIGKGRFELEGVHRVSDAVYQERISRAVPQDDDIIFAREAPVGNAAIIKHGQKMCLGQRTVLIRPDAKKVCPDYLVYYILAPLQQYKLLGTANGATVAHVNLPMIRGMNVDNLPPLKEQRRIADILSAYDDLIENNRKQIKLLEEAAQRLYKEWFIDLHFPGYEHTKIINGIPEGWKKGHLDEVMEYHDSLRKPLSSMERNKMKGYYRYFGAAGILDYINDYLFDGTYLLLGEDGSVITKEGNPILQYIHGKFWVNNHAHILTGKQPYSTEFIYMMFQNMIVSDVVTGVAQPKISQARLSAKDILIPDQKVTAKYNKITKPLFDKILVLEDLIVSLQAARDLLLPKLMNGEMAVSL